MEENKSKNSISVKEIETFAKKHCYEMFFCLIFLLACIFGIFGFFHTGWSILCLTIGSIVGMLLPTQTQTFHKKTGGFILKQEAIVQMFFGIICIIFSIFIPFILYLGLGIFGGRGIYYMMTNCLSN